MREEAASTWMQRVIAKMNERKLTVADVCTIGDMEGLLKVSRPSFYVYKKDRSSYPKNSDVIQAIAKFLGEAGSALENEMRAQASGEAKESYTDFLGVALSQQLDIRAYQNHIFSMARALGMRPVPPKEDDQRLTDGDASLRELPSQQAHGVDVAVALLRQQLPQPPDPFNAVVAVVPRSRGAMYSAGSQHRGERSQSRPMKSRRDDTTNAHAVVRALDEEPYQYQIYIIPVPIAEQPSMNLSGTAFLELTKLRSKVDGILDGVRLPVTREYSKELALELFRDRSDVLLYPGLLDARPPDALAAPAFAGVMLVTGVYYAGAPDVAAILARYFDSGYSTFDQIARFQVHGGLPPLPSAIIDSASARVAAAVLGEQSVHSSSMVWATDNPDSILTERARSNLASKFKGTLVLLELSDEALDYATYRLCHAQHHSQPGRAHDCEWPNALREKQRTLSQLADTIPGSVRFVIRLPDDVTREPDGSYPDAVGPMFDRYLQAALWIGPRVSYAMKRKG